MSAPLTHPSSQSRPAASPAHWSGYRDRDAQGRLTRLAAHVERTRPLERIVGKVGQQLHVVTD